MDTFYAIMIVIGVLVGMLGLAYLIERTSTTRVSEQTLAKRLRAEGINPAKVVVMEPRWAEWGQKQKGAAVALVKYDLLIRSDGTAVALDCIMATDSMKVLHMHTNRGDSVSMQRLAHKLFPEVRGLSPWAPAHEICKKASALLGWNEYVRRLTTV